MVDKNIRCNFCNNLCSVCNDFSEFIDAINFDNLRSHDLAPMPGNFLIAGEARPNKLAVCILHNNIHIINIHFIYSSHILVLIDASWYKIYKFWTKNVVSSSIYFFGVFGVC